MINGITFLFVQEQNRSGVQEYVMQYCAADMLECFTTDERTVLSTVGRLERRGSVIVNMGLAARALAAKPAV